MFASPGGASQFGGGGFLPLPSQGEGERKSQQQKQGNQTLRALTFAQILKAVEENGDRVTESLMIDGNEVTEVKSVCQIMDIQDTHAYTQYRVDDSTGMMLVRQFKGGNQSTTSELKLHKYAQVFGHLRTVESTVCLMAYSIRPVENYNMVHHHLLEVIHQHLQLTRGPLRAETNVAPAFPQDSNAFQTGAVGGGSMYGANPTQWNMGTREGQFTQQLKRLFVDEGGADNQNGLHIDEIIGRLQGNWPRPEVENLLGTMLMEGKLYNTTPNSYQWCS